MTYGVLYEFERTSTNGADIRITIRQKWYEGEVKKRALGRAPVIKRDNNGHIYGTSCEIYAECLVDGEFSQLYTSDAFEFRVDVYRNEILIWQGFVSPELYSEPDIAPPYDVQIIATDGLGELKNYNFEKRGVASILSHINYLIGKSGVGMAFNVVSGLRYINSEGTLSAEKDILNINIDLDHEEGNSCYDVLQNIMSSLNANITQHNGRYLIFRETDFINKASGEVVEAFDINGTRVDLPVASFGSMKLHQWWPIGQLSTVIEPAKNEVIIKSPDFYKKNGLKEWSLTSGALYDDKESAYSLPSKNSAISQTLDFGVEVGYRIGLRVRARNVGAGKWGIGESSEEQNLGVKVEMHGRAKADYLGNQFWLVKSEGIASGSMFSDYIWSTNDAAIGCEMSLPSAEQTAADAQNIDIVIPLFDDGTHTYGSYAYADQLKITIFNPDGIHKIYVYDVSLVKYEQTGGYEADVIINNAAREGASDIDLAMTAGDRAPEAGAFFMTGLPLQPATKNAITQWQIGNDTQDYLSAMAYDYSRAIALPKMKYSGSLNVPGSATVLPTLFLRDGTYYFPKTYSYDLYNDEMSVELISISAADVSLAAVIISQYAQPSETMGASTTGAASPGGTAISFPRDTEMSETSDNAVENRVIKAYVDNKVLDLATILASMWTIENGQLVATKDVYIKANLTVTGDTTSGGSGSNTPASGTVTGINVNGQTYEPTSAGIVTIPDYPTSLEWSAIEGKPTALSQFNNDLGLGSLAYLSGITSSMVTDALGYTPLSTGGGTISGETFRPLIIDTSYNGITELGIGNKTTIYSGFGYTNGYTFIGREDGGDYPKIGIRHSDGTPVYSPNNFVTIRTLIHSGNIGSYKAGDSALFDGRTSGGYYLSQKDVIPIGDLANLGAGSYYAASAKGDINPLPIEYCSLSVLGRSYYSQQLCMYHNATRAWLRGIYNTSSGVTATDWHELAFTDSTVEAANKLATARTIWGQSFDGTGNVSGVLSDVNQISFDEKKSYGIFRGDWVSSSLTRDDIAIYTPKVHLSGNVLIGTATDSGYKLDVNGEVRATTFRFYDDYRSRITLNGSYIDIISAGNEMCIGTNSGDETMYINYRNSTGSGTAKEYWWNAGSSTSWANHHIGGICCSSAYPISLFAVGSGTYNRTVVEYSSSGLIIERARKTDSYSGEIIPLIISQRGGGVAAKFDGNDLYVSGNLVVSGDIAAA